MLGGFEVLVHGGSGGFGIALAEGGVDRLHAGQCGLARARVAQRQHAQEAHVADILVEQLGHAAVGHQGAPGIVEAAVGFKEGAKITIFFGGDGIIDGGGHAGQIGRAAHFADGNARRSGFEQEAQLVDLFDIGVGEFGDHKAAPLDHDHAFAFEAGQGFAHGGAGNAQLGGEADFLKALAGADLVAADVVAQLVIDPVGEAGRSFKGLD